MKGLRALESALIRLEGAVAVALVLLMLALAGYNVLYRNVLVPLQKHWAHSGPKPTLAAVPEPAAAPGPAPAAKPATPSKPEPGAAEGFGGDWGEGGDAPPPDDDDDDTKAAPAPAREPAPEAAEPEAAEGFGGDWGEGGEPPPPPREPAAPEPARDAPEPGAAEGFGGDWGEGGEAPTPAPSKAEGKRVAEAAPPDDPFGDDLGDEEDPFANLPMIDAKGGAAATPGDEDLGGPPEPGSFAARMVSLVDALKLSWIDVVLRQLVILVSFFGGMLATHRGKHINVDALSKLLGPRARRGLDVVSNGLALAVCLVLARAGADLVAISREHPHELVSWADEWTFQLMFPLGFGLLAFHFALRLLEAATGQPHPGAGEGSPAAGTQEVQP
ncbi:MAG: TRAP transporter small permease [Nannocystaceae bacterium]|nr:TRAP transporter small permease [Nannocystaceae bacterium]